VSGEVLLVARSIGRSRRSEPLSPEGHAGLVFALGGGPDLWIAQAGPDAGLLQATLDRCTGSRWEERFARARGAIWETDETEVLPVSVLGRTVAPPLDGARLAELTATFNERRWGYLYDPGPNSNTYARMLLEALGCALPPLPAEGLLLRGWSWGA
jgi:hypothetical protein